MKWHDCGADAPRLPAMGAPVLGELRDGHSAVVCLSMERNATGGMIGLAWRLAHPAAAGAAPVVVVRWANIPKSSIRGEAEASIHPVVPEVPGRQTIPTA